MEKQKDPLAALRRRLEKAELEHLRRHAADLAERLEKMEDRAIRAEDQAEWYWQNQMDLIASLTEQGETIGMTVNGHVGIVNESAQDHPGSEAPWSQEFAELHRLAEADALSEPPLFPSFLRSGPASHSDHNQETSPTLPEAAPEEPGQDQRSPK